VVRALSPPLSLLLPLPLLLFRAAHSPSPPPPPRYNAFRFFIQNAQRWDLDAPEGSAKFAPDAAKAAASTNLLDVWIHASVQGLTQFVHEEMKNYRLYTVVPRLVKFVEQLTNWYVAANARLRRLPPLTFPLP
jgi:hypothetical protein